MTARRSCEVTVSPSPVVEFRTPSLTVRLDPVDGTLHLVGTLDHRTVSAFHAAVSTLLGDARRHWVIAMEGLQSCDVVGLRALSVAYRRTLMRGRRVVVTGASPRLCRALPRLRVDGPVLENTALDDTLLNDTVLEHSEPESTHFGNYLVDGGALVAPAAAV
jgi:anti-anti-sigma factor